MFVLEDEYENIALCIVRIYLINSLSEDIALNSHHFLSDSSRIRFSIYLGYHSSSICHVYFVSLEITANEVFYVDQQN